MMNEAEHHHDHHQQQQQSTNTLLYNAEGQPVAISLPPQTADYELYNSKQSKISGFILIVSGILNILLNGIGIALREVGTYPGHGFWGGILFIVTGAFGVAAAGKKRCPVITYLVLDILSACSTITMFTQSVVGAIKGPSEIMDNINVGIISAMLAMLALFSAPVAIWGSSLVCKVACCGRPTARTIGLNQPVVIFTQQPYFTVPQVDPISGPGAPPAYMSSVGDAAVSNVQQQQLPTAYDAGEMPAKM